MKRKKAIEKVLTLAYVFSAFTIIFSQSAYSRGPSRKPIQNVSVGNGDINAPLVLPGLDKTPANYEPNNCYVEITLVSWMINGGGGDVNKMKEWFTKHVAAASVTIDLFGSTEKSNQVGIVLGEFPYKRGQGGQHIGFMEGLSNVKYPAWGGKIAIRPVLQIIEKKTEVTKYLASLVSLTATAATAAFTSEAAVPAIGALLATGQSATKGLQEFLSTDKQSEVFPSAYQGTEVDPEDPESLKWATSYVLFHKGASHLNREAFHVVESGNDCQLKYGNEDFEDGVWFLFRIKHKQRYSVERPWLKSPAVGQLSPFHEAIENFNTVFDCWKAGTISVDEARKHFAPKSDWLTNIFDPIRHRIGHDVALTEREKAGWIAILHSHIDIARKSIEQNNPDIYIEEKRMIKAAWTGESPAPKVLIDAFKAQGLSDENISSFLDM